MSFLTALVLGLGLQAAQFDKDFETDVVTLDKGKPVEGRVVYEDDEKVVVRKGSREKEYDRAKVTNVESRVRNLATLLDRMDAVGTRLYDDAGELLELAKFAEAARLNGEARALYLAVLIADPEQPDALEWLECRERRGAWQIKHGSKFYPVTDLPTLVESWKDRWTLSSVHYEMETNLPLRQGIKALFDLERFYRAFMDIFQVELELYDPIEVIEMRIHDDEKSFPERGDGRKGWFDPSDRLTHVVTVRKPWRDTLFHEAVHHLFHMTTVRSASGKGRIPAWLDEGMGELFGTSLEGEPGFATFDLSKPDANWYRAHADADKPYDFSRMMAFEPDDYFGSVDRALKYAQSYTLTHYLLFGTGDDGRDKFMDFMRSAYLGRSSSTDFQKIMEVKRKDDFEEAWMESVKDTLANL